MFYDPGKEKKIYIFLRLNNESLLKVANRFGIKKEINYDSIDPLLNLPKDSKNRPLEIHSEIKELMKKMDDEKYFLTSHKTMMRRMGLDISFLNSLIFNQDEID